MIQRNIKIDIGNESSTFIKTFQLSYEIAKDGKRHGYSTFPKLLADKYLTKETQDCH